MINANRKRLYKTTNPQEEEDGKGNPFTGAKDPYKILGVEKGCSKEEVKQAWRNYLMKVHPDKALHLDILDPDEATLACREVIAAKSFFDDFFSKNTSSSSSGTTSPQVKKPRTNTKPFEVTEEEQDWLFQDCQMRVSRMEQLIDSQGTAIKSGFRSRSSLESISSNHEKMRSEFRKIGTLLYKLKRSKVSMETHQDLENID